jgi:hypothetical protein
MLTAYAAHAKFAPHYSRTTLVQKTVRLQGYIRAVYLLFFFQKGDTIAPVSGLSARR